MISFPNKAKIEKLKQLVRNALNQHIDRDYVLLDVPNYRNIGDTLIWQGELEYLKELPHKCLYSCNPYTFKDSKIPNNAIILLQGGGNFGDVWGVNQKFRNEIVKKFPNNKIIVLPQTIHYQKEDNLIKDSELFNAHKNLILCVRDEISYKIAKDRFASCETYLLPDMAFFNDFSMFHTNKINNRTLLIKRVDKELGDTELIKNTLIANNVKNIEIQDWPGFYEQGTLKRKIQVLYNIIETKGSEKLKNTPFKFLVDDVHGLKRRDYKDYNIRKGIEFINQYDVIYSTRLHGFILAVLLNKEVYIFDNSYGKNKNFFNAWLSDFDNVKLISK